MSESMFSHIVAHFIRNQSLLHRSDQGALLMSTHNMFHGEISKMSQIMTKPTKWHVRRVKTDQPGHPPSLIRERLCCPHEESLGPYLHIEGTAKTLFRLGRCPG